MKKFSTLFSLIIITSLNLSAQTEWAPIGAKWYYEYPYNNGNAESYVTIESISDTVIDGITCKILQQQCIRDPYVNRRYYTYKNQDKVWVYGGSQFRVLYDFTVQPQGQWTAYGPSFFNMCDTVTIVQADAVGTEDLNGVSFKYIDVTLPEFNWNFSFCGPEQIRISEKFGSYGFMFPQQECTTDIPAPCSLRCYQDSEFGFYSTGIADSCNYEYGVGTKDIMLVDNVNIAPNPVKDILTITVKGNIQNSSYWLYDATGSLIRNAKIINASTKLDLSHLMNGTYIIKVYHESVYSGGKIIKL